MLPLFNFYMKIYTRIDPNWPESTQIYKCFFLPDFFCCIISGVCITTTNYQLDIFSAVGNFIITKRSPTVTLGLFPVRKLCQYFFLIGYWKCLLQAFLKASFHTCCKPSQIVVVVLSRWNVALRDWWRSNRKKT